MLTNVLEIERRGEEGCEFDEPITKQLKVNDKEEPISKRQNDWDSDSSLDYKEYTEDEDGYEDYSDSDSDSGLDYKDYTEDEDGYEDYSENENRFNAGEEGIYVFSVPINDAILQLSKSFDYDYTLSPDKVQARIQAFLTILTKESNPNFAIIKMLDVMKLCDEILYDFDQNQLTRGGLCHELRIRSPFYFSSHLEVNRTIQDVVALLRCSPYSLGIVECIRVHVDGLLFQDPNEDADEDTDVIPTDLNLLQSLVMKPDASCIIVVEKYDTFEELASDCAFNQKIKSILLSPGGYPDTVIRFLLRRLNQDFPDLPIYVVVDWEPAGLAALCAYKFGSIGMGLEAYGHGTFLQLPQYGDKASVACNVKWLGLRWDDLERISEKKKLNKSNRFLYPLKRRDHQIADRLIESGILEETYMKELKLMMEKGVKAEFEALYCAGCKYLGKFIAEKIEKGDYI